ncbi:MAG: hypothetical protein ACM3U2_03480 [Deltaproteobacteria bacterium]
MTRRLFPHFLVSAFIAAILAGCNPEGESAVSLAEAGGVVTFKGAPLPDATVMFVPEKGPVASGVTDLSGKFKLMTGSRPGATVGTCKVTVTAQAAGAAGGATAAEKTGATVTSAEEGKARQEEMMKMQRQIAEGGGAAQEVLGSGAKSLIPERYAKTDTSNLSFKVEKDASKNQFNIDLTE